MMLVSNSLVIIHLVILTAAIPSSQGLQLGLQLPRLKSCPRCLIGPVSRNDPLILATTTMISTMIVTSPLPALADMSSQQQENPFWQSFLLQVAPSIPTLFVLVPLLFFEFNSTRSELKAELMATETKLKAELKATETKLSTKIDMLQTKLSTKIDMLQTELSTKIDMVLFRLGEREDVNQGRLDNQDKKIDNFITQMDLKYRSGHDSKGHDSKGHDSKGHDSKSDEGE
jgi:hypothetical protein